MLHIILGGTFDPIHWGHLRPLLKLGDQLNATQLQLMPSAQPPHRDQPGATAAQRLKMVELACQVDARLCPQPWELEQARPSYTQQTLAELQAHYRAPLAFVLGYDSWQQLHQWFNWQQLLHHAHLIVLPRPQLNSPPPLAQSLQLFQQQHQTAALHSLQQMPSARALGKLYFAKTELYPIAATQIREAISRGTAWQHWLPQPVADFIVAQQLYQ